MWQACVKQSATFLAVLDDPILYVYLFLSEADIFDKKPTVSMKNMAKMKCQQKYGKFILSLSPVQGNLESCYSLSCNQLQPRNIFVTSHVFYVGVYACHAWYSQ